VKSADIASGRPGYPGFGQVGFARREYPLGRAKPLEQEPCDTGTNAVNVPQPEPVCVDSWSHCTIRKRWEHADKRLRSDGATSGGWRYLYNKLGRKQVDPLPMAADPFLTCQGGSNS